MFWRFLLSTHNENCEKCLAWSQMGQLQYICRQHDCIWENTIWIEFLKHVLIIISTVRYFPKRMLSSSTCFLLKSFWALCLAYEKNTPINIPNADPCDREDAAVCACPPAHRDPNELRQNIGRRMYKSLYVITAAVVTEVYLQDVDETKPKLLYAFTHYFDYCYDGTVSVD